MLDEKKNVNRTMLILIAVVVFVAIAFWSTIKFFGGQEVMDSNSFINEIDLRVEQVLDYKPSKERVAFLELAREVTSKDKMTYDDSNELRESFYAAQKIESTQAAASKKIEVSEKLEAALDK